MYSFDVGCQLFAALLKDGIWIIWAGWFAALLYVKAKCCDFATGCMLSVANRLLDLDGMPSTYTACIGHVVGHQFMPF